MQLTSDSFVHGAMIPDQHALATPHPESKVTFSDNTNPHLEWSDVPPGTKSFAVICVDSVAPTEPHDVNQESREVPPELPRADFVHWVAVDLPGGIREIQEGEFASGVVQGGRDGATGPHGCRQGVNDYTGWFSGDPEMQGTYLGYDGPGPPWNDSLVHEYAFSLYALDVARLPVVGGFSVAEVETAMEGHVLAQASITGLYTLNPRLR